MRTQIFFATALAFASPALAQTAAAPKGEPGTEEGAKALVAELSAYLSQAAFDSGIVKVEPDPAGYRITVAFKSDTLFETLGIPDMKGGVDFSAYTITAGRLPDGNWAVASESPIKMAYNVETAQGRMALDYDIGPGKTSGIWSPAIGSYTTATGRFESGRMTQVDPQSQIAATFGPQTFEMTSKDAGGGRVDLAMTQTFESIVETIDMADPTDPTRRNKISVTFEDGKGVSDAKGYKIPALMDIWAYFVAHPDKQKIAASQDELKTKLTAVMPLWDRLEGTFDLGKMMVETPAGAFGAQRLAVAMAVDGVEAEGDYGIRYEFGGISVDSPAVPAWALPLIPLDMVFAVTAEDLDLATPAEIAIADLDIARPEPISPEASARISASFSEKPFRVVFDTNRVKGRDYELTMTGDMAIDGAKQPEANFTVEVTGLDTVIKTLQDAGAADPAAFQAVGPISMAKGFAKQLPDGRSQWIVNVASDGSVKINGAQIKGPDVEPPVIDEAPTDENAVPTPQ